MGDVVDQFGSGRGRELDSVSRHEPLSNGTDATFEEMVPRVLFHLTTAKVLTMEFVDGISLAKIAELMRNTGRSGARTASKLDFKGRRNLAFAALHSCLSLAFFTAISPW